MQLFYSYGLILNKKKEIWNARAIQKWNGNLNGAHDQRISVQVQLEQANYVFRKGKFEVKLGQVYIISCRIRL